MSDDNQRPTVLEIIGKVLLAGLGLIAITALAGVLVFGACALLMR